MQSRFRKLCQQSRHRGRKEKRLAIRWQGLRDPYDLIRKSHFKQPICFVEDDHLNGLQREILDFVEHMDQAAWSGDPSNGMDGYRVIGMTWSGKDDVGIGSDLHKLLCKCIAAHHHSHSQLHPFGQFRHHGIRLQRQFSRRRNH